MSSTFKNSDGKTVTVSYPTQETKQIITQAEYDIVRSGSMNKVTLIKFIRSQYGLGLYEAKQVVETICDQPEASVRYW